MGQQDSKQSSAEDLSVHDFVIQIQEDVKNDDIEAFRKHWTPFIEKKDLRQTHYEQMLAEDIMDFIKGAFRSQKLDWRREGILVARTFFDRKEARRKLIAADFIGSVLLITLPEEENDGGEEGGKEKSLAEIQKQQEEQDKLQLLAVETFNEMAHYPDFLEALCQTSVLNLLCIVLNQVPKAQEIVTATFVKLSNNEKNLIVLMEGAMGDILETFFKTVNFQTPHPDSDAATFQQWRIATIALSNTAHALGMLIKYNHPAQVDMPTIIKVFYYSLAMTSKSDEPKIDVTGFPQMPDNVQLLAELSQLFYWKCRTTQNTAELIRGSAPRELGLDGDSGLDFVLRVLVAMWKRCCATQTMLQQVADGFDKKDPKIADAYAKFCVDDLERSKALDLSNEQDLEKLNAKKKYAEMRLCYLNCTLWVLLPMSNLRWKLRDYGLEQMHLAFKLRDEAYLLDSLGTVRYLVDFPAAQESHAFIQFLGEQLLILLDLTLKGEIKSQKVIHVLLDAISILAMGRDMQAMLAKFDISEKLRQLCGDGQGDTDNTKVELAVLRSRAEVAIHPSHRLSWVCKRDVKVGQPPPPLDEEGNRPWVHPPRSTFKLELQEKLKNAPETGDNFKTIASLLLTIFKEEKFRRDCADIDSMFRSVIDWWLGNTTTRFNERSGAAVETGDAGTLVSKPTIKLDELLKTAMWRQAHNQALTVRDSERLCAPHECVIVLSMFSRLALEPRFKKLFVHHQCLEPLLGCICAGIWAEAREAAATLANLMWLPDASEEALVCWLKFDGPKCIALDASNVLMPVKSGHPKPVDIGKGMYKSSWGIEFVDGSVVKLHPGGLKTHEVPGILTTASPSDTFSESSQIPYEWLSPDGAPPDSKVFSITCWFYWPLSKSSSDKRVLVHSTPADDGQDMGGPLISYDVKTGRWTLMDRDKNKTVPVNTPDLNPGWHMLSVVSSTEDNMEHPFNGTKFYLDEWSTQLDGMWIPNDFFMVGNGATLKTPFGLITDFRIYSRVLKASELEMMARARDTSQHPDQLARKIAKMDAATILAQRLDVPDSAAECLRALGSLATLASQRAKIFSVCGRRVLQMIDSPLPMIQRQAARLINNIT